MPNNNFMSAPDATAVLTPYAASIKNLKITALKETSPATSAHEVGTYLTYNNVIYSVKAAIAVGDTLTVNTNIEVADIPEGAVVYWEDDSSPSGQVQSDWNQTDNTQPDYIKNKPSDDVVTLNGNPLSFTTDSEQAARECIITLEPIQAGSGDPSPSNVRAISGYDKILIDINLWNTTISISGKYLTAAGEEVNNKDYYITDYIEVEPNCSYEWHIPSEINANVPSICWYDDNKAYISGESINYRNSIIIATTNNTKYIRFSVYHENKNYRLYKLPILFNYSDSLPETVYGGTLNVETGELVVDTAIIDMGDLTYYYDSSNHQFYTDIFDDVESGTWNVDCMSSYYSVDSSSYTSNPNPHIRGFYYKKLYLVDTNNSTSGEQKTAVTGQKLVYELATPYTIHLTPAQVRLLKGNNVVTTNGTSIKLTYRNGELATLADVSSVAESVNALGKKVEEIELIPITINTDYVTSYDGYILKCGRILYINVSLTLNGSVPGNSNASLFTISQGGIPTGTRRILGNAVYNNAIGMYIFKVLSNGIVEPAIGSGNLTGSMLFATAIIL